jgi:hypothetical protein
MERCANAETGTCFTLTREDSMLRSLDDEQDTADAVKISSIA